VVFAKASVTITHSYTSSSRFEIGLS